MRIEIITILMILLCTGCSKVLKTPNLPISSLSQNINNIKTSNTIIKNNSKLPIILASSKEISISTGRIEKNIKSIDKGIVKLVAERDRAIKDRDSQINRILGWLVIISIIGAGIFGVLFFLHGNKLGLTGAAICLVVMSISIFVQAYYIYIIIFGGLILVSMIGLVIYNVVVKNKAFSEIVTSVELIKGTDYKDIMNSVQSKVTQQLVDKEKNQ